ncbi:MULTISPECIES: LPO_1073/Vpar_1526 family protein [Leeuwenhoekiella]|nr:LPO_1073/Vpar_1526 family protein [Leeuwenhoekiella blandensis]
MMKDKKQEGGDGSSNIQAENVNVYNGITYKDAKEIALDVFNSNFIRLKSEAAQIAAERAEEITEKIVKELNEKSPESLEEFKNPAMQDALFQTQKEYAKSGDEELGNLLVDILVDRAKTQERNMLQLVLDESLLVAPKLTVEHFDLLTLNFLLAQTVNQRIRNLESFTIYIKKHIIPFADDLRNERTTFNHLEYLGCGHIRVGDYGQLEESFKRQYKAMFSKGFSLEDFENEVGDFENSKTFIMPCLHDRSKFQMNTLSDTVLEEQMTNRNINQQDKNKLKAFFNKTTMNNNEIRKYIISIDPKMESLFDLWNNSSLKKFELSGVGISIAHANFRRKTGETLDLSIWIK